MAGLFSPSSTEEEKKKKQGSGGLFNPSSTAAPQKTTTSGGGGLFKPSTTEDVLLDTIKDNPYDTASVEKSIANAKARIESSGYKTNDDKRNPVEKFLNLPQDQNWFFDTLDVLNRPQQGLFGAMNAVLKTANGTPTSRTDAFLKGITGKEKTRGSDILKEAGVKNKYISSPLGLVADIAVDPLNAIPAKWIGAGIKATTGTAKKGLGAVESAVPAVKTLRENKVQPALQTGKDALGKIFVPKYKWDETLNGTKNPFLKDSFVKTENDIRYQTDDALKKLTDTARKVGGLDKGTDVGRIMEKDLRQFQDVPMFELPDGVTRTTSKRELGNKIIDNKQQIKILGTGVREANKALDNQISQSAKSLEKVDKNLRRTFLSEENKKLKAIQNTKNKRNLTPEQQKQLATDRTMSQLSDRSPGFNVLLKQRDEIKSNLDQVRDLRKASGQNEIGQIQKLVDENKAIKESAKNPVMVQREIPRPQRDLSTDPKVTEAANALIKSNDEVRQWAISNDIPVGEIEGYMRHILSTEEQAARKLKKPNAVDRANPSMNNPNKGLMKNRQLMGSVEDVNDQIGRKFFEPNAFFSTAIGQKKLIEYGNAVNFRREVLSNPDFARKVKPGKTPDVAPGQTIINTNNYKFLSNPNSVGMADEIGGEYLVTNGVKQALDRYQKLTTDEGINAFMKAYDTLTSGWKKLTLLSPEYHVRNDLGAKFNNYVAGMNPVQIANFTTTATKDVANALARGKETPLYNEFKKQGLGSNSQLAIEFARHGNDPDKALRSIVKDQSRTGLAKGLGVANPLRVFKTSQELGAAIDQINRFALYKWARQAKNMTPEQAAAKVKEVQFDYSDLTPTERELFVRVVPFYRWARNNIPFQLKQLATQPSRYENVNKLRTEAQNFFGMDPNNEQEYTKNNFTLPVSGDGKGNGYMLGLNLPLADLTKLSNPTKLVADSLTPLLKTPLELSSNYDLYRGRDIQQFEGERSKLEIPDRLFGVKMPASGTPLGSLSSLQAHALKQLGGNPARELFNKFGVKDERAKAEAATNPVFGITNILKKYDINQTNYYEKKDELRKLMDLMDYIEQETGSRPKTLNEIKKGL